MKAPNYQDRWPFKLISAVASAVLARRRHGSGSGSPRSLTMVTADLNPAPRAWFEYFKHSHRCTLGTLDGWIRRRLRSILREQQKRL